MVMVGRVIQRIGLTVPLLAIMLQLGNRISLLQMLVILVASVCIFWIGHILEGLGRRPRID